MTDIAIYKAENGEIQVELEKNTVWLRQTQMARLFGRERSVITRHIGNVFKEGELDEKSNVQNMHIANSDKSVKFYNLDVIISVGYRVKSQSGTAFRQWATRLLNEHLVKGFTLNQQRFEQNPQALEVALTLIRKTASSPAITAEAEARQALADLKRNLIQRNEATELFANERSDGLSSILGNLDQTVFQLVPTLLRGNAYVTK